MNDKLNILEIKFIGYSDTDTLSTLLFTVTLFQIPDGVTVTNRDCNHPTCRQPLQTFSEVLKQTSFGGTPNMKSDWEGICRHRQ